MEEKKPESKKLEGLIPRWFVEVKQMLKKNENKSP